MLPHDQCYLGPHPAHLQSKEVRLQGLIVEGWIFSKCGLTQEALVSYQNALDEEELCQHSRHLLDNVSEP